MKTNKVGPVTLMVMELEKLRAETNQLKDTYLRSIAEFDNFRRRKERETSELRELANEELLGSLIPVLDNFDRALQAAQANNASEGLQKGVLLIASQLKESLAKLGFEEFSCLGQPFDPRRCEAVGSQETEEHAENTVIAETAKGYAHKSRVVRPALVIVARAGPKDSAPVDDQPPTAEGG
jgi:molecular chaperone GrpE